MRSGQTCWSHTEQRMKSDIIINKTETIKRCIKRINEEYDGNPGSLNDYTKQDSIILNIQRLCEAALDLALHVIKEKKLTMPQSSRDAFTILCEAGYIDEPLTNSLCAMIGFRNLAVHDYQKLNLKIVEKIVELHIDDALEFAQAVLNIE